MQFPKSHKSKRCRKSCDGQVLTTVAALLVLGAAAVAAVYYFSPAKPGPSLAPAVAKTASADPEEHVAVSAPTSAPTPAAAVENTGALVFESTTVRVPCAPTEDSAELFFRFTNKGDKPVRVVDVEVTCGCLEAGMDKAEYKPGESGQVKAIMKVGVVEGEMSKPIKLMTNDPAAPVITLEAVVDVPVLFQFEPTVTTWKLGEDPSPKIVRAKILWKDPIQILKATSTRENVTPTVREVTPGREYEIVLTPKSTEKPELGLISVETTSPFPKYTRRQIYFNVVRPKS